MPPSRPIIETSSNVIESKEANAIANCTTFGFSPSDITVSWTLQGGTSQPDINPDLSDSENKIFKMTSNYVGSVDRTLNGKNLTCTISHMSLKEPISGVVLLTVLCK